MSQEYPNDLPREELLLHAQETVSKLQGVHARVMFKFTCENCKERVTLSEPNVLYESGECCVCGHTTEIKKGGYTLEVLIGNEVH